VGHFGEIDFQPNERKNPQKIKDLQYFGRKGEHLTASARTPYKTGLSGPFFFSTHKYTHNGL
jgi:hypothetical protein